MSDVLDHRIGIVTAYGYAVSEGYAGTEEQFAEDLAHVGVSIEEITAAINIFNNETVPAAVQSVTDEGTAQIGRVSDAGTTQIGQVSDAGTTQIGLVTAEGTSQCNRVAAKGDEIIASIPSDYTALTEEVDGLSDSLGNMFSAFHGSYVSKVWAATAYSAFIKVFPGSRYKIIANSSGNSQYYGLKNATIPPAVGDVANLSDAEGWNSSARVIDIGETEEGTVPSDVNYLYFYLGPNAALSRKPAKIEINGIDVYDSAFSDITILANTKVDKRPAVNKTIAFFGDSVTAGSGWTGQPNSQGYHQYIHDLYGYTCLNYGYGGTGYTTSYDGTGGFRGIGQAGRGVSNESGSFYPNNVRARLAEVTPSDLDGVVIFSGSNDYSHQVPLADFAAELDTTFGYYQTNFGDVPLLVMTPIHRINDTASTSRPIPLIEYVNTIIQKCRGHGIPYIDTFTMSGLQPNNIGNSNAFFPRDDNQSHSIDGIHPNHLAHQRLARCIGETLNQMMLWDTTIVR